ncbi:hypothetical protein Lser_V15G34740 [Lactuca serriola]
MSAPAPAILQITNDRLGKVDAHVAKSRAFQLTAEEDRAAPDVVIGSFLVNNIHALVLFDSGATRSFVSLVLSNRFVGAPGELDCPLDIDIADDRSVRVARVHRGCILQLFSEQYLVDLVLIPLSRNNVIVGMDWLRPNGVVIECEQRCSSGSQSSVSVGSSWDGVIYIAAGAVRQGIHSTGKFTMGSTHLICEEEGWGPIVCALTTGN